MVLDKPSYTSRILLDCFKENETPFQCKFYSSGASINITAESIKDFFIECGVKGFKERIS